MAMYVYAPAGVVQLRSSLLKSGVEFIGSKQFGFGSNWAKGKRYIKERVNCSGAAIKRACVVKNRVFKHDYEVYGTEVYYFHTDFCALIVKTIIDYLVSHRDDPLLPQALIGADFDELLDRV